MIYEVRTHTMKPGAVPQFEENFGNALPHREKYSELGAFWHTEIGPLNQVIHVWPYKDLKDRTRVRNEASKSPHWPTGAGVRVRQENKIMVPAAFSPMR